MKPLICPQCGGKITEYNQWQKFATCHYCDTRFIIEEQQPPPVTPVNFEPSYDSSDKVYDGQNTVIGIIAAVGLIIGVVLLVGLIGVKKKSPTTPNYPSYPVATSSTPIKPVAPTPNPNALEFGGKGTGNGLFQGADSVAVDKKGRIYVADDSLRVQQFNEKGEFLKVWQIPTQTQYYKRARTIQKIMVDDQDRLYVLVGGVVQMWEQKTIEKPEVTYHAAPDFMVDFALRSDGGLVVARWPVRLIVHGSCRYRNGTTAKQAGDHRKPRMA